ncbi:Ankyrin repeat and KH domain-containing protein 1 [Taenia crassiceps]|uniref:Ankyrin repeat and KH domain-containing protein 1 n=1 Tax=Taenia crassiceps TaxID=6207 RepID=A0ABR4QIC4_9CEST
MTTFNYKALIFGALKGGLHSPLDYASVEMTDSHCGSSKDEGKTGTGSLTLSQAIRANNLTKVKQALRKGADPNAFGNDDTTTPLIEAAIRGFSEVMEALLLHGASTFPTDVLNNTALHWATANCHMNCVVLLLKYGCYKKGLNSSFRTPLMQAAFYGHDKIAQYLIDRGAEIGWPMAGHNESALTIACERGNATIARILLRAGESSRNRDRELHIALTKAASGGHPKVVKLLLDQGAEVNRYEDSVDAPIFAAICGGNLDIVKLLIAYHANIEERNKVGYTPLMLAAQKGAGDMVTELLDVGANIDAIASNGSETALSIARTYDRSDVEEMLLSALAERDALRIGHGYVEATPF